LKKRWFSLLLILFSISLADAGWKFDTIAMVGLPRSLHIEGLAKEAYGQIFQAEFGPRGEIYYTCEYIPGLFVIDNGIISRVAGMDRRGYRDGPAEFALFSNGANGYPHNDLAVDSSGNIFMTDGSNKVVRKIYKNPSNKWIVSTFAGGGSKLPSLNVTIGATELDLGRLSGIAIDSSGNIWVNPNRYLIKITPSGQATPVYLLQNNDGCVDIQNSVDMAADDVGNIYGIALASTVWKYSEKNGFMRLTCYNRGASYDGPTATASTVSDLNIAVASDGAVVYFGGGDEAGILRKIEDEGGVLGLRVKSLMQDGTWQELPHWKVRGTGMVCGAPTMVGADGGIYLTHCQYSPGTTRFRKLIRMP
jgi:hypothetical protein